MAVKSLSWSRFETIADGELIDAIREDYPWPPSEASTDVLLKAKGRGLAGSPAATTIARLLASLGAPLPVAIGVQSLTGGSITAATAALQGARAAGAPSHEQLESHNLSVLDPL